MELLVTLLVLAVLFFFVAVPIFSIVAYRNAASLRERLEGLEQRMQELEAGRHIQPPEDLQPESPPSTPADQTAPSPPDTTPSPRRPVLPLFPAPPVAPNAPPPRAFPESIFAPYEYPSPADTEPTPVPLTAADRSGSLEKLLGKYGIVWLGIMALFLSIGFLVKYAFDNQWIGPTARIVMGVALGIALLVGGDRSVKSGWRIFGESLLGGGLAIVYLSLYAGFTLYHLFTPLQAILIMVLITAMGLCLAAVKNAVILAVVASLGGYLAPVMVPTRPELHLTLLLYLLILDAGVLAIAFYKGWQEIGLLAVIGGYLLPTLSSHAVQGIFLMLYLLLLGGGALRIVTRKGWMIVGLIAVIGAYLSPLALGLQDDSQPLLLVYLLAFSGLVLWLTHANSWRQIGWAALLGIFAAPYATSGQAYAQQLMLPYLLLLDLPVLWIGFTRRWHEMELAALVGTWLLFANWFANFHSPDHPWPTTAWVCGFYLLFLIQPLLRNLREREPITLDRLLMVTGNAVVAFAFLFHMLAENHRPELALLALFFSATCLALGTQVRARVPGDANTLFGLIALAVSFLTLAIPLWLHARDITVLWAAEGPVLLYLGYRYRYYPLRVGGLLVLAIAVCRLFIYEWPLHTGEFVPFLNGSFAGAFSLPVAIACAAYIHARWRAAGRKSDDELMVISGIAAGMLGLLLLQNETGGWLRNLNQEMLGREVVTTMWALGGLLFVLAGVRLARRAVAWTGACLLLLAGIACVYLYADATSYALFVNARFGAAVFLFACQALAWWAAYRRKMWMPLQQVLFGSGEVAIFVLFSTEVYLFGKLYLSNATQSTWLAHMLLSIAWAVYASGLLCGGFLRRSRGMRITALGIFCLVALKMLLFDLAELQQIYRILSFFIVGLLMIGASYLYNRAEKMLATPVEMPEEESV